jgi:hypothetical protein
MTGADPAAFSGIGFGEIFDVDSGRITPRGNT